MRKGSGKRLFHVKAQSICMDYTLWEISHPAGQRSFGFKSFSKTSPTLNQSFRKLSCGDTSQITCKTPPLLHSTALSGIEHFFCALWPVTILSACSFTERIWSDLICPTPCMSTALCRAELSPEIKLREFCSPTWPTVYQCTVCVILDISVERYCFNS